MAAGFLHQCTPQSTLLALSAPANLSCTAMAPKRTSPAAKTEDPKQLQEALQLERKWTESWMLPARLARLAQAQGWAAALARPTAAQFLRQELCGARRMPAPQASHAAVGLRASSQAASQPSATGVMDRDPEAAGRQEAAATSKPRRSKRVRKAVLEVSDRAKVRLAEIVAGKDPAPVGIRLGVRTRG